MTFPKNIDKLQRPHQRRCYKILWAYFITNREYDAARLNTVLTTLIKSADMWERGRTSKQIENGNFPIEIKVCTSVDGGAWIAHRGFILLVLCISDYEMLLKLGKLIVFIILVLYWYLFKHNI